MTSHIIEYEVRVGCGGTEEISQGETRSSEVVIDAVAKFGFGETGEGRDEGVVVVGVHGGGSCDVASEVEVVQGQRALEEVFTWI